MGVVGPRHQLGKSTGVVLLSPSSGASIPKDSHTLVLIPVAQQDTHPPGWGSAPSPRPLRAAEAGAAAVPPLSARPAKLLVPQGQGKTMAGEPERRGHSSRECTHLSQGCSHGSSGPKPTLYLLQTKSVCTENCCWSSFKASDKHNRKVKILCQLLQPSQFWKDLELSPPSLPPSQTASEPEGAQGPGTG